MVKVGSLLLIFIALIVLVLVRGQSSIFDFEFYSLEGDLVSISQFINSKAVLVVNVASRCGRSYENFKELAAMQRELGPRGLQILAFSTSQFGTAEPGNSELRKYADKHQANFPIFAKVQVNGYSAHPMFSFLKKQTDFADIAFNFEKFLVLPGSLDSIRRYGVETNPQSIVGDILPHLIPLPSNNIEEEL